MYEDTTIKIWGSRKRLLLTSFVEVDLLDLKKDSFCSIHFHDTKYNYFYSVSAIIQINTELGNIILNPGEDLTINPHITHQFRVLKSGKVIEVAYVKKGKINVEDIKRATQGGKIIDNLEFTENKLRKMGYLKLDNNNSND